jgi:NitT/TauT family transport system substrate-binding protein
MSRLLWSFLLLACFSFVVGCDAPQPSRQGNSKATQNLSMEQGDAAKKILGKGGPGELTKVTLLLNWYPEAEHGGFYAAQVLGIFEQYGLDVEIRPGGKTIVVPQELILGRIQFGVANADDVLVARNQDLDLVGLMAPIQDGPRCILTRKDSGIDSFEKLRNVKLQIDSTRPYVPFLKSKGLIQEGVEVVPYFGSVSQVVAEKGFACQGYNFSEPFMARKAGVEVNELMLSSIGYNPYASLLVTTEKYVKTNPEICEKMVKASIEGWRKYLENPDATNVIILKNNKQGLDKAALDFGVGAMKKLCIPEGESQTIVGQMSLERWTQLYETLASLKLIDGKKGSPATAFTDRFLSAVQK